MEKIIIVETTGGQVVFSNKDTTIHFHENPMLDYISQELGVENNQMRSKNYPIWALGRGTLQLADVLMEQGFGVQYHEAGHDTMAETIILTHFGIEVELIEQILESWK